MARESSRESGAARDVGVVRRSRCARRLAADESEDTASGWLTEISWERFEHMRLGLGYNFTDFSDDLLRDRSYTERSVFLRLQGVY